MRQHRWWLHTTIVVGAAVAFMLLAAWMSQPWWEYAFLSDDSAVSWLSSALLMANAAVALNLALTGTLPIAVGSVIAASLAVLSADEQFLLHERFKEFVPPWAGNVPTVLVGVGGVVVLIVLRRSVRSRQARRLIAASVALGVFALWVDLGSPPPTLARFEEAFEVVAEALFLSGLLEVSRAQVQSAS
jgi:hypothetical protein